MADIPRLGAWLLFCQQPTDRALTGWNAMGNFSIIASDAENFADFLEFIRDELCD